MTVAVVPEIDPPTFEGSLRRTEAPATLVVDVRDEAEAAAWPPPTAPERLLAVPLPAFDEDAIASISDRAAGRRVEVVCDRGNRSRTAAEMLISAGVDAVSVRGGMAAWSRLLVPAVALVIDGLVVVQMRREARGCLGYLLVAGYEALAVDPTGDWTEYVRQAERHGARIVSVLDTHVHADHVSGARQLSAATKAQLLVPRDSRARGVRAPGSVAVGDAHELALGATAVRIVALPGHTTDMTGVVLPRSAGLLAGDSLFTDAVARPDLQAGAAGAEQAARVLHATIHERILPLGEACVVLPGHYPGGRRNRPVRATLGELMRGLELLGLSADAFVERVLAEMPPRPANYEAIIAGNLAGDDTDAASLEIGANGCAAGS